MRGLEEELLEVGSQVEDTLKEADLELHYLTLVLILVGMILEMKEVTLV